MPRKREVPTLLGLMTLAGLKGPSWFPHRVIAKAMQGLPLTPVELKAFQAMTGRVGAPTRLLRELWLIIGRRGGKSRFAGVVTAYLGLQDYSGVLADGEIGTLMVIASDRKQARTVLRYINAVFHLPGLSSMVERRTKEAIYLKNRVVIEITTASFRSSRGYTVLGVVADEIAYWPSDESSAEPDKEILDALRPGMALVPNALLVAISSPYARRGELWKAYERFYGKDDPNILVVQAQTSYMNRRVPQDVLDRAQADDPAAFAAEYGAEFRKDREAYVSRETVTSCTNMGVIEISAREGGIYHAFCDPSGGSQDSMTLAVAHRSQAGLILDFVTERRPPFDPQLVVEDFAAILRSYGLNEVRGDFYGGEWVGSTFQRHGVHYMRSQRTKSELYQALLPLMNSGQVKLLDLERLRQQLLGLERRVARGGRDSFDHGPRGRDDLINAAAGALLSAVASEGIDDPNFPEALMEANRALRTGDFSETDSDGRRAHWDGDQYVIGAEYADEAPPRGSYWRH